MPESNEPRDLPEGKTVYLPASPDTQDIPFADDDADVPEEPKPDPVAPLAPPPEPPDEPIDEGAILLD